MIINDVTINASCEDVLQELQRQLMSSQTALLQKIKDSGTDIMVQCPYHGNGQERKPSAGIRKSDGMFHCFACGETHTLPEVISFCLGHPDDIFGKHGFQWIMRNFATVQIEDRRGIMLDLDRSKAGITINAYVSEEELDSYRYYHSYWKKRGIIDEDTIELFDLGYDKNTDCITMPIRDKDGKCLFVARRSVKTKWFNYPKGVEKPLYGLYELRQKSNRSMSDELFITESMIDCILLWQAGFYAVALNGTGNDLQFNQLKHLYVRHMILATDNDKAGQDARQKIRERLSNKIITEIMFPTNRKDIGECTPEEIKNIKDWEVW